MQNVFLYRYHAIEYQRGGEKEKENEKTDHKPMKSL